MTRLYYGRRIAYRADSPLSSGDWHYKRILFPFYLLPDATSSYADIGTTQPTFSSKPSITAGICCQFAVYYLPVY